MPVDVRQRIDAARASMVSVALQLDILSEILPGAIESLRDAQVSLENQLDEIATAIEAMPIN